MSKLLSRSSTNEVITCLEELLKLTLFTHLPLNSIRAVQTHFNELRQITDDFAIQVDFGTEPALRQTKITFILTPKSRAIQ
jgi:hypothetical protein